MYANMQGTNRRAVLCIEHIICLGVMTCRGVLCIEHIMSCCDDNRAAHYMSSCAGSRAVLCIEHIICLGVLTVELYCVLSTLYVLVC